MFQPTQQQCYYCNANANGVYRPYEQQEGGGIVTMNITGARRTTSSTTMTTTSGDSTNSNIATMNNNNNINEQEECNNTTSGDWHDIFVDLTYSAVPSSLKTDPVQCKCKTRGNNK